MSSFIPSNKQNMYANCGDDDESMAETNSLNHSMLEDNEKNEGIYSSKPYKRLRKIVKGLVFGIVTLIAIIALCLAVLIAANQHLYSRDGAVISNNGVISGTDAEIETLKTLIGKVNATLTKRIDTQYEESDGHHETLNHTIHLKHSDLVQAVDALKKEIGSKITQLETALRSKVDSDRQDVQGLVDGLRQSLGQLKNKVQSDKTRQQQDIKTLQDNYRSMQTRLSNLERSVTQKERPRYSSASKLFSNLSLLVVGIFVILMST